MMKVHDYSMKVVMDLKIQNGGPTSPLLSTMCQALGNDTFYGPEVEPTTEPQFSTEQ